MIGKHDFKHYKKGSIVPKRICNGKSKARRTFVFGSDAWVVHVNGRCQVYLTDEHEYSIICKLLVRSPVSFKDCDLLNVSGKRSRAAFHLLQEPVKPVGLICCNELPTPEMLAAPQEPNK